MTGLLAATYLGALLFEERLVRQADTISLNSQHLDQNLVAFLQYVSDIRNTMFRHFTDVQQAVGSRKDFNKCPEVCQPRDPSEVGLPDFGPGGEIADHLQGAVGGIFVVRYNVHPTGVFNVNFHAGPLNDAANHLAVGPNHVANLVDRDLQGIDARTRRLRLARAGSGMLVVLETSQERLYFGTSTLMRL